MSIHNYKIKYPAAIRGVEEAEHAIMLRLLEAADRKVQRFMHLNGIKSCKIDVGLAPDELRYQDVYLQNGFEIVGRVMDKYRLGEEVIELGRKLLFRF